MNPKPRAVFLGKTRLPDRLGDDLRVKFGLLARHLDAVTVNSGPPRWRRDAGVRTIVLPALRPGFIGGPFFYVVGPILALALSGLGRDVAVVCQSPFEGFGVTLLGRVLPERRRPRVQVELHGDWRTGPRLYGGWARGLLAPFSDRASAWAVRRADRVRVVSEPLEQLARTAGYRGEIDRFITFSDYRMFLDRPPAPLPDTPTAAFIGVLERYKAVDVLLDAWPLVLREIPDARLWLVGAGSMHDELHRRVEASPELTRSVEFKAPMPRNELAQLIDRSTCLVLPSRSEGLPRIVVEAMARGRAVVASTVGGMRELIDETNGRLVEPEDVAALAEALTSVLSDSDAAAALGAASRAQVDRRTPEQEYEAGIVRLAQWIAAFP